MRAIQEVIEEYEEEREDKKDARRSKMVVLVLLDVKNAFSSVEWGVIIKALKRRGVSPYLRRVISSYLQNRWIIEGGRRYEVSARVPQKSLLGPTLRNIAYDDVLAGFRLLAYADDLTLAAKGITTDEIEQQVNETLESKLRPSGGDRRCSAEGGEGTKGAEIPTGRLRRPHREDCEVPRSAYGDRAHGIKPYQSNCAESGTGVNTDSENYTPNSRSIRKSTKSPCRGDGVDFAVRSPGLDAVRAPAQKESRRT